MGEVKTSKTRKNSWFKGIKAEFNKIIWPNKITLAKESTAVIVVSILLGVIITIVDFIVKYGIDIIVK
ncbi:MAG: preprotein translocase subunit SecE [Eubacteriales bacterium]